MDLQALVRLTLALAIGLLAGLERGWKNRDRPEGARVAGLRTFGLIGLLGGVCGTFPDPAGTWLLTTGFGAVGVLLAFGYNASAGRGNVGITTEVSALVIFALAAVGARGYEKEAAAGAVVTTLLLRYKPVLHRWVENLGRGELEAVLKFLLLSAVILPNLPDRGFGPWKTLNPYHIWWMVVLIAGISFAGYISIKTLGPKGGIIATSLLGGLVSSTAVTLSLSRLDRRQPQNYRLHAAGIVLASTVMYPRILLLASTVNPAVARRMAIPIAAMALAGLLGAWLLARGTDAAHRPESTLFRNPLELHMAFFFGAALAVVTLLSVALKRWVGDAGVYAAALTAGILDVDAITLSLSRLARGHIEPDMAANAVLSAAAANSASKALIALFVAQRRLGLLAAAGLAASLAAGAAALALF